jgi:type II secretory pathway predicted ATPase ExeA
VVGESQHPLILHGPRGCGKTTLIARAAQCCHTWQPEALLLIRFVSVSAQSHTTEQLLRTILDQCSILTYGQQSWAVHVSCFTLDYACHLDEVIKRYVNPIYHFCSLTMPFDGTMPPHHLNSQWHGA